MLKKIGFKNDFVVVVVQPGNLEKRFYYFQPAGKW